MSTTIDEQIAVLASFRSGTLTPRVFQWREKKLSVESVSFTWSTMQGAARLLHFTVVAAHTLYELVFNTASLTWRLEQIEA